MYRPQIQLALAYIEANLTSMVDPRSVARAAGFSRYHFHRIFREAIGEPLGDYVRRRRLSEAASMLRHAPHVRIIEVALLYQFESQAAFTRAFRRVFGVTPGQYRRTGRSLLLLERPRLAGPEIDHLARGLSLEPTIVDLPALRVVGLPYRGTNRQGEIPGLWPSFQRRADQIPNRTAPGVTLGVCLPVPQMTDASEIDWLWAAEVDAAPASLPHGMVLRILPASRYAVFTHRGSVEQLAETYRYIMGAWFPRTAYTPVQAPDFELYDASSPDVVTIYMPLQHT